MKVPSLRPASYRDFQNVLRAKKQRLNEASAPQLDRILTGVEGSRVLVRSSLLLLRIAGHTASPWNGALGVTRRRGWASPCGGQPTAQACLETGPGGGGSSAQPQNKSTPGRTRGRVSPEERRCEWEVQSCSG